MAKLSQIGVLVTIKKLEVNEKLADFKNLMALYGVIEKGGLLCQRLFPVIYDGGSRSFYSAAAHLKNGVHIRDTFHENFTVCDIKYVSLKTSFLLLEIAIHADVVNLCRFGSYALLRLHVTHAYTIRRFLPHFPNAYFRLYHLAIEISVIFFYLDCESHMDDQNLLRT